jgi:hypothetical protein
MIVFTWKEASFYGMVLKTEVRVVLVHKEADDIKIAIFQVL